MDRRVTPSKRVTSPIPGVPHLYVNRLLKIGKVPIAKVKLVVLKQRQRQIILHEHCINETCDNIRVHWSYLIFSRTYHWKGIQAGKNQRDIDKNELHYPFTPKLDPEGRQERTRTKVPGEFTC